MTDDPQTTPNPATPPPAGPGATTATEPKRSAGVSRGLLIGVGVAIVLLSFLASFLGASLARSNDTVEAVPTPGSSEAVCRRKCRLTAPALRKFNAKPSGFCHALHRQGFWSMTI